jgi:hypothetical protein
MHMANFQSVSRPQLKLRRLPSALSPHPALGSSRFSADDSLQSFQKLGNVLSVLAYSLTTQPLQPCGHRSAFASEYARFKLTDPFQIMPHRDFPALAALLLKPQHELCAVMLKIAQPQLGYRSGPAGGESV